MNRPADDAPDARDIFRDLRHELRTPINHIVGYSELLLDVAEERDRSSLVADLRKIHAAGQALLALVAEYLDPTGLSAATPDFRVLGDELRTR